ncbi:hypothetical protein JCM33774_51210 [Actinophytocola sp. KF-1]
MLTQMRDWIASLLGRRPNGTGPEREGDVPDDHGVARTRATGGQPGRDHGDDSSTTGPGENEEFVGRVAGNDDVGAVGETGAEARSRRDD